MTTNTSRERWVLAPGELEWEHWDDLSVVFQHAAGKTHFLNAVSHLLLQKLAASPLDADAVARGVAQELGFEADTDFLEQIRQTLMRFEQLGLIRKTSEVPART